MWIETDMTTLMDTVGIIRLNLIFFGGLLGWTFLFIPLSSFLWAWQVCVQRIPARRSIRDLVHFYGQICCRLLACQVPIHVDNRAGQLPMPCIITPNHQSFFDPYCLGLFRVVNLVFAVRAWPFSIPLYGRVMRKAGYLNTEEMNIDTFVRTAGELLREGSTVIIFPEGTRSRDDRLGRFHSGAFKLAVEYGVPVVPMCINGTGRVFPKGSRFGRRASVRVSLLEPVRPEDFSRFGPMAHLRLQRHVKAVMKEELDKSSHATSHSLQPPRRTLMSKAKQLFAVCFLICAVLAVTGCRKSVPIVNHSSPIPLVQNVSDKQIAEAIIRAGAKTGWEITPTKDKTLFGTLHVRGKHRADVIISYNEKTYSITYKDSDNLDYEGGNIHPNYNKWVSTLDANIRNELAALSKK
jgi:1-acyl-sn-glycerol-3-phosphate acyltransferase